MKKSTIKTENIKDLTIRTIIELIIEWNIEKRQTNILTTPAIETLVNYIIDRQ